MVGAYDKPSYTHDDINATHHPIKRQQGIVDYAQVTMISWIVESPRRN